MELSEAIVRVEHYLGKSEDPDAQLAINPLEPIIEERSWCYAFSCNTVAFWKSRDPRERAWGCECCVVNKDESAIWFPMTYLPLKKALDEYAWQHGYEKAPLQWRWKRFFWRRLIRYQGPILPRA